MFRAKAGRKHKAKTDSNASFLVAYVVDDPVLAFGIGIPKKATADAVAASPALIQATVLNAVFRASL